MVQSIDFYFDFSSPYGYLAALKVPEIETKTGLNVIWHPILLGAVFKTTSQTPLMTQPVRGAYFTRDMERCARKQGVPMLWPDPCPFASQAACRAFYHLADQSTDQAVAFARSVYISSFGEGKNVTDHDVLRHLLAKIGADADSTMAAITTDEVKEKLKAATQNAIDQGVFGSPSFIVGSELFWGHDRIDHLIDWCQSGGW